MLRMLFIIVAPLLVPTVLYVLWRTFAPRRAGGSEAIQAGRWEDLPWPWLSGIGVTLLAFTLGWFALSGGGGPDARYQPPRLIDGKIEPGRMIPPGVK
jgi:hypothetical protein